jgi:hypothetical protein
MKKIISGKMYNTETAEKLDVYEANCTCNDFNWFVERLYQKKTKEYFLNCQGGPLSLYSAPAFGGGWTSGEYIKPLTTEEAKEWAQRRLEGEEYEAIFGIVEE